MHNRAMRLAHILSLALASSPLLGCTDSIDFTLTVDASTSQPVFSWDQEPARSLEVYQCDGPCPDANTLSADGIPSGLTSLWRVDSFGGVEAGGGALRSPVTYGTTPDAEAPVTEVGGDPDSLAAGSYLVRVELLHGGVFHGYRGFRWVEFAIKP